MGFLGNMRGFEWIILIALIVLLFGAKRLPDAARGLGRSLRIFKAETKGLVEDGKNAPAADAAAPGTVASVEAPASPVVDAAPATSPEATDK